MNLFFPVFKRTLIFVIVVSSLFLFSYCSKSKGEASRSARVVGFLFANYNAFDFSTLLPTYSNWFNSSSSEMESYAKELKDSVQKYNGTCNTDELSKLQSIWKKNVEQFRKIEIFFIGPAKLGGLYESIDPSIVEHTLSLPDTNGINQYILGTSNIDSTSIASLSKLFKGLSAIEYLLFDDGSGNRNLQSICNQLTNRRYSFLKELVNDYYNKIGILKVASIPNTNSFYDEIRTSGSGSNYFSSPKIFTDSLLTLISDQIERTKDYRLGYPMGISVASGGVMRPNTIESRFSGNSISNAIQNIEGIKAIYYGVREKSLSSYIAYYNPPLDQRIKNQLEEAISKLRKITNFNESTKSTELDPVREAIQSINILRNMFTIEIPATTGSSKSGSSTSGDGD